MQGFGWVTERDVKNYLTWDDSCLMASTGRGITFHPKVNAKTSRESGLDMAFQVRCVRGMKNPG